MDWKLIRKQGLQWFGKYKYAVMIFLAGLVLMNLPSSSETQLSQIPQESVEQLSVSDQLRQILSRIDGVGRTEVMITEAEGALTHYQTDLDETESADTYSKRQKTVLHSSGNGETGLVRSISPPVYLGAIVVCEGGGNPTVAWAVVQAVSNVTGISSDRITVLKMK